MLGGQGSPYVGRFACDWHRLPGTIPGQPQTRTGVCRSVAPGREGPRKRPCRREEPDLVHACPPEHPRALGGGRARGEDVVHEHHASWRRVGSAVPKGSVHGPPALLSGPTGLCRRVTGSAQECASLDAELRRYRHREGPGLVVSSRGPAAARQRDPGHAVGACTRHGGHCRPECLGDASPPLELQPMQGGANRSLVEERRSSPPDEPRWAIAARRDLLLHGAAAGGAGRGGQHDDPAATRIAERPGASCAARAPSGEEQLEHGLQHAPKLGGTADTQPGP